MKTYLIKKPLISEKSLRLANEQNIYSFEVDFAATKTQIKAAVEELFEVEVTRVNTLIKPSKRRRVGRQRRTKLTPVKKKALVQLKEGQTIDLFDIGG